MPIRIVLVEDHALTRHGLRTALEQNGIEVVGESGDGLGAEAIIRDRQPDVALVDLGLPGRDGVELTRALKGSGMSLGIVIITMQEHPDQVFAALAAGADAYCVKASDIAVVLEAVRAVAAGGAYFDPRIAHLLLRKFQTDQQPSASEILTPRELDVLKLVADGLGNADIASTLFLGIGTVKGHLHDILEKLGASDRAQAAVIAFRRGWLR